MQIYIFFINYAKFSPKNISNFSISIQFTFFLPNFDAFFSIYCYLCHMKQVVLSFCLSLLILTSCDMFRSHPYDEVFGVECDLTAKNIKQIEAIGRGQDTIRFAFISDTQRQYNDTRRAVDYINDIPSLQFVLHGGDLTDFGITDEFRWMQSELSRLDLPFLTVIGNHDFVGFGENNYQKIYGPYNYSLNVGHLHLVCLNTSSREQDYTLPVPDFGFIADDIKRVRTINSLYPDSLTHTVVMMHSRPGDEQFNNNVAIPFQLYLSQYPGMGESDPLVAAEDIERMIAHQTAPHGQLSEDDQQLILGSHLQAFCLNGHNHTHQLQYPMGDQTLFYQVPDIHSRQFYVFSVYPNGYDYESVYF